MSSVAYDGRAGRVAAGSGDGTVTIWDEKSGKAVHTLRHDRGVWALAFSPDGRLLAAGEDAGTVRLWNVADGRELTKFRGHSGIVYSMAFNPDGTRLVSGSWDGTAKVWDVSAWTVSSRKPIRSAATPISTGAWRTAPTAGGSPRPARNGP